MAGPAYSFPSLRKDTHSTGAWPPGLTEGVTQSDLREGARGRLEKSRDMVGGKCWPWWGVSYGEGWCDVLRGEGGEGAGFPQM